MNNDSFLKTCIRLLRFEWLADWLLEKLKKLEKHSRFGLILSQVLLYLGLAIYGFGIIVLFRINDNLWESLGIYYGFAKVFFNLILPVGLAYLLSKTSIFNIIVFAVGFISIFTFFI